MIGNGIVLKKKEKFSASWYVTLKCEPVQILDQLILCLTI